MSPTNVTNARNSSTKMKEDFASTIYVLNSPMLMGMCLSSVNLVWMGMIRLIHIVFLASVTSRLTMFMNKLVENVVT